MHYNGVFNRFVKKALCIFIPDVLRVIIYPVFLNKKPVNPFSRKTISSLINYNKIFSRSSEVLMTQDKILSKLWVRHVAPNILIPKNYFVKDDPREVDYQNLPNPCVLKASHGCGFNFIYKGQDFDIDYIRQSFIESFAVRYGEAAVEWSYKYQKPKIFAEQLLVDPSGDLRDYKVYVVKGVAKLILVDSGRYSEHTAAYYSRDWRKLKVSGRYPVTEEKIERPVKLKEMLDAAEAIAKPFSFLRVDFYVVDDEVWFGEVAHYPQGGYLRFSPPEFNEEVVSAVDEGRDFKDIYYQG